MALDLTYVTAANDVTDLTVYTFTGLSFGAADANRYVIVCIQARVGSLARMVVGVTIGGVAATIVVQIQNGTSTRASAAIAIAAVPSGASGDVVVTWSGAMVRCAVQVYRMLSPNSPTPSDTDTSIADNPTATLTVTAGGAALACATTGSGTTETWSGATLDSGVTVESNTRCTSAHATGLSAGSLAITCTFIARNISAGVFATWDEGAAPPSGNSAYYRQQQAAALAG